MAGLFYNTWNFFTECGRLYRIHKLLATISGMAVLPATPHHVYDELYELILAGGSIYIKFAQWYISHLIYDNHYAELCIYFTRLFEACPSQPLIESQKIYEEATNRNMADDMDSICEIGSGSIGTVYYAKEKTTGREVAIKIKHPHIDEELDKKRGVIAILKRIQHINWLRKYFHLCFNLDDFIESIYMQTNLMNEANNMAKMRTNMAGNKCVIIPEVIFASPNVLVMEYINTSDIMSMGCYEKNMVAINMVALIYQMCLVDNFVHGDLHYKNWKIHIEPVTNRVQIVLFDMGICFSYNDDIDILKEFWASLEDCDIQRITVIIKKMCMTPLTTVHDAELEALVANACKNRINSVDILRELVRYFTSNNLIINQYVINIVILICLVEKFLKMNGFIQAETPTTNIFSIIHSNRLDIISYCACNNSYPAVQSLLKQKVAQHQQYPSGNLPQRSILIMDSPDYISDNDDTDDAPYLG